MALDQMEGFELAGRNVSGLYVVAERVFTVISSFVLKRYTRKALPDHSSRTY